MTKKLQRRKRFKEILGEYGESIEKLSKLKWCGYLDENESDAQRENRQNLKRRWDWSKK